MGRLSRWVQSNHLSPLKVVNLSQLWPERGKVRRTGLALAGSEDGGRELLEVGKGQGRDTASRYLGLSPMRLMLDFGPTDYKIINLHCFKLLNL